MRSSTSKYASHTGGRPWAAQGPFPSWTSIYVWTKLIPNAFRDAKKQPQPTLWDRIPYLASYFIPSAGKDEDTAFDFEDFESAQENFDEPDETCQDHGYYDEDSPKYKFSLGDFVRILSEQELERLATATPRKGGKYFITSEGLMFFPYLSVEQAFPSLKLPKKQNSRFIRRYHKDTSKHLGNSHFRGSGLDARVLDSNPQYASVDEASDGIEEECNVTIADGDFGILGAARWRAGPGRKKSWRASPRGKVPSGRQRRRGKRATKSVGHCSGTPQRHQRDQRLGHEKHSSDVSVQIYQHRSVRHRAHYIWVDEYAQYATATQIAVEPRISIQTAGSKDADAKLVSVGQRITVARHGSNEIYDATAWNFQINRRKEAFYQSVMSDVPPRLPNGPIEKAVGRGKKNKQRGITKFNIPRVNDLEDLRLALDGFWVYLRDKLISLREMAIRKCSNFNEGGSASNDSDLNSYSKLYKTVKARRLQIIPLESVHATVYAKNEEMKDEVRLMKGELHQVQKWLASTLEQYQIARLQSALHKDRFFYSLPQPAIKSPPQCPLLHKNFVLEEGPESFARLLEWSIDDAYFMKYIMKCIEEVRFFIDIWEEDRRRFLRRELQIYLRAGMPHSCA